MSNGLDTIAAGAHSPSVMIGLWGEHRAITKQKKRRDTASSFPRSKHDDKLFVIRVALVVKTRA
jgi:hypothetical protein